MGPSSFGWIGERMGANRRFGLVLVAVCALVYGYGYWHGSPSTAWLIAALVLAAITVAMPRVLQPLLGVWMKIGGLMHVIVSPILLVLFYFGAVLPIGLVLRLFGKDLLHLKRNDNTYWIERQPPGPQPKTMTEVY
jgi:hypothetical protein